MSDSGIRNQKQLQADSFIRSELLLLQENAKMPSIRKLMKTSGLGRIILEKSLHKYCEKQLLRVAPKSGFFRTGHRELDFYHGTVDVIACSEISYMDARTGFQHELASHLFKIGTDFRFNMRLHRVNYHEPLETYLKLAKREKIDFAFLQSPHSPEIVEQLCDNGIRCVTICPRYACLQGPAVINADNMMEIQLNYLFRRGHSRIAYFHEVENELALFQLQRRECFYRMMCEHGFRVPPEFVPSAQCREDELRQKLNRIFSHPNPPTALISGVHQSLIYAFLKSRHLVLGRDVSLITEGESFDLRPRPTAVLNSRKGIAHLAWEMMENLITGHTDTRISWVPLTIVEGNTVADLSRFTPSK